MTQGELGAGGSVWAHHQTSGLSPGNTCTGVWAGMGEKAHWSLLPAELAPGDVKPLLPLAHVDTPELNEELDGVVRDSLLPR